MQNKIILSLVILLVAISVSFNNWGLTESSEARYAEISREMFLSGNYLQPKLLDISHFHKPPVTYYLTSFAFFLFGVNEFAVRFFPAIAFLLQLFFLYKAAGLLSNNREVPIMALLLYFSYPISHIASANLTTDVFLATFIFGSIYCYLKYRLETKQLFIYLFYLFSALAFLTKGPVGVLPGAVFAVSYNVIMPREKNGLRRHHVFALLLGIFLSFSWFLILVLDNPKLLDYFLGHQVVDRVASNSFGRTKPAWYYVAFMPLIGLPAILLFFDYSADAIRKRSAGTRIEKILLVSFSICFLVFTLSASKLILYVLPLYFFIALLSAMHISQLSAKRTLQFRRFFIYFNAAILVLLLVGAFVPIPGFRIPVLPVIVFSAAGLLCLFTGIRSKFSEPVSVAVTATIAVATLRLLLPFVLKSNESGINSIKPLAKMVDGKLPNFRGEILVYDQFLPSMAFYTGRKVVAIYNGNINAKRETQFEPKGSAFTRTYFDLGQRHRLSALRESVLQKERIVVAKLNHDLPDSLLWLRAGLNQKDTLGKWVYYYQ